MKRIMLGMIVGGLGGMAIGFMAGIFIYPFWFLNDIVNEQLQTGVRQTAIAEGMFIQPNTSDPIHWGKGKVKIYQSDDGVNVVFLEKDFEVGPGPRYHIYLADSNNIRNGDDFRSAKTLDLGRLRAFRGSQVYPVSTQVDVSKYGSVVIWCEEFGVLISPAALSARQASIIPPASSWSLNGMS